MDRLRRENWDVAGLVRTPQTKKLPVGEYFHYAFPSEIDAHAFARPVDILIHCAFAMRDFDKYQVNREAVAFLKRQPAQRMLFISSMSAHEQAESLYGREKLYIEKTLDSFDAILRPGFVIGQGGIFRNLARSIRDAPVIPLFYGGAQPIQTVWIDDLSDAVASMIRNGATGLYSVAEPEPHRIRDFYQAISEKLGLRKPLLPLPGIPALWALKAAESLGIKLPMHSDNLLGLKHLIRRDVRADLARLGLKPRSMQESLALIDWAKLAS